VPSFWLIVKVAGFYGATFAGGLLDFGVVTVFVGHPPTETIPPAPPLEAPPPLAGCVVRGAGVRATPRRTLVDNLRPLAEPDCAWVPAPVKEGARRMRIVNRLLTLMPVGVEMTGARPVTGDEVFVFAPPGVTIFGPAGALFVVTPPNGEVFGPLEEVLEPPGDVPFEEPMETEVVVVLPLRLFNVLIPTPLLPIPMRVLIPPITAVIPPKVNWARRDWVLKARVASATAAANLIIGPRTIL